MAIHMCNSIPETINAVQALQQGLAFYTNSVDELLKQTQTVREAEKKGGDNIRSIEPILGAVVSTSLICKSQITATLKMATICQNACETIGKARDSIPSSSSDKAKSVEIMNKCIQLYSEMKSKCENLRDAFNNLKQSLNQIIEVPDDIALFEVESPQ